MVHTWFTWNGWVRKYEKILPRCTENFLPGLLRPRNFQERPRTKRAVQIHLGHSPDPDDAFMFYALAKGKIPTGDLGFKHVLADIETLNQWGFEGKLEVTALSLHAFAYLTDRYALLPICLLYTSPSPRD